jgi:outer membrane protein assembly factor BamB/tRNA A-37 threonylcarbamoyl transferase component Bud32
VVHQLTQHDPRRIGPFEVLGRLGAGGMGLVYLARSASGRRVAIKTVRAELAEDQLFRVRFAREVEAARAVSGFYTAAVVDADPRAAVPWLATAFVPAPSLEEIVTEAGPLPVQAVRWLAAGVAEALQSIHGAGLVHRDLKPSNVLVVEDGPRVIDFGIASGVSNTRLTMTNVAVGTPAYMSPEQAKDSRSVTGASDVFSLGSTLVFAATGHPPFHGANPVETVFMLLREGPNLEGLPDELRSLIESCMRTESEHRLSPADLQAQLAPHLFSAGGDDTGTASAWLPSAAVALIERRRSGGRPAVAAVASPAPNPPQAPAAPPAESASSLPPQAQFQHPVRVQALPLPQTGGPVQLSGSAPIGPGLRLGDRDRTGLAAAQSQMLPGFGWTGRGGTSPAAGSSGSGPVAQPPTAPPGEWRPWRFRMSNDVWGTPVVSGGRLYVTSFEVHALDVATGRRQFKTRDVAWIMTVADGFIHGSDGPSLYALATDGSERWRTSVDGWIYSLRAEAGTVVTGTRGGGVQGWDAAGGQLRWERGGAQTEFETPESGPCLVHGVVYHHGGGRLHALDAVTGANIWSYPTGDPSGTHGGMPTRPVVAGGVVYLTSGARVFALDAVTGAERWRFEAPAVFFSPPAHVPGAGVTGGGVYVADYLGTVYALDPDGGCDRWRVATEPRQSVEPVLVAGGAVMLGAGSAVYTLDAASGTPKWRFATQGEIVGSPVVADGRVHFGSMDRCLYTVDAGGGQLRWKLETGGEITGSPLVAEGVVYASSKDRCVYALDAAKGTGAAARR